MDFICLPDEEEEDGILREDEVSELEYPIEPILREVSKMLEINIKSVPSAFPTQSGPTPEQINDLLIKQNVTFMKVCAPTYIACKSSIIPLVAPSMMSHSHILTSSASENKHETPMYYSVFVSSKNITVCDLKKESANKSKLICAVNDVHSLSGYHCIRMWLNRHNLMNDKYCPFSRIIISGSHLNSIKLIENGVADIAAIDIFILLPWILKLSNKEKEESNIHILDEEILGPHHSQILCIDKNVLKNNENLTIKKLQNAFVSASHFKHIEALLTKEMMVQAFVNVDHNEIRRLETVLAKGSYIIKALKHYYYIKTNDITNNTNNVQTKNGIFELVLASFDDIQHNRFAPINPFPSKLIRQKAKRNLNLTITDLDNTQLFNAAHIRGTSSLNHFIYKFVDKKYDGATFDTFDTFQGNMMIRMISNLEHHNINDNQLIGLSPVTLIEDKSYSIATNASYDTDNDEADPISIKFSMGGTDYVMEVIGDHIQCKQCADIDNQELCSCLVQ